MAKLIFKSKIFFDLQIQEETPQNFQSSEKRELMKFLLRGVEETPCPGEYDLKSPFNNSI